MNLTLDTTQNNDNEQVCLIFSNNEALQENTNQVAFNFKQEKSASITLSLLRDQVEEHSQQILTLGEKIENLQIELNQKLMSSDTLDVDQDVGDFLYYKD